MTTSAAPGFGWSAVLRRSLLATVVSAGSLLLAAGCSEGYDIPPLPAGSPPLTGDRLCQADKEPGQGDRCSQDCLTATCAGGTGRRICTCEGGVFLQCACLPPDNWPYDGVPTAPYCDRLTGEPKYLTGERCTEGQTCISSGFPDQGCTCINSVWSCGSSAEVPAGSPECEGFGNGIGAVLDEQPCDQEWRLCIARDFNPSGTSPRGCVCQMDNGRLLWSCGATNRWFRAE